MLYQQNKGMYSTVSNRSTHTFNPRRQNARQRNWARAGRVRFRFNSFNIACIAAILILSVGFTAGYLNHLKKNLDQNTKQVAISSAPLHQAKSLSSINSSSSEYYLIDSVNNQWRYSGPALAVNIKKKHDATLNIWYYVSDIILKDPKAISSGLSDEIDPSKNRATPGDLAANYKAVLSTNGDLFVARTTGIIIRNGKLWRNVPSEPILAFYANGDMKVFDPTEKTAQQLLDEGVTNTFAFGPILIRGGAIDHANLKKNSLRPPNPRTGIGMVGKNHFISIVVEGRQPGYSDGITLDNFALLFQSLGCQTAYNLDGGQSSAMMFMGKPLNSHANDMNGTKWNSYRHVSEILIFGTSKLVPTNGNEYGTPPS